MIIKVFPSDKGDCLLLSSSTKNILIDGGMSDSFKKDVSAELGKLRTAKKKLDLVCVSHIDEDHIAGILQMIEDEVQWRVFDFQSKNGNAHVKKPKNARPPVITGIWHNAFNEVLKKNTGAIEETLASQANVLSASSNKLVQGVGELAQSVRQAIQLSQRLRADQLNIPLNKQPGSTDGKLMMFRKGQPAFKFGTLAFHIIAPFEVDLKNLRNDWNTWLENNTKALESIKKKVEKDQPFLSTSTATPQLFEAMATQLTPIVLEEIKGLGKRKQVTPPNLASLMFLVKEGKKTALMTGDGHWEDILKGLEAINELDKTKGIHVDVLKVQHHGAKANIHQDFCKLVTADHYIFCGNGEHTNPELDVIKIIIESRTSKPAITAQAKNNFTLVFNSSSATTTGDNKTHMKKIEKLVKDKGAQFKNVKSKFPTATSKFITITV